MIRYLEEFEIRLERSDGGIVRSWKASFSIVSVEVLLDTIFSSDWILEKYEYIYCLIEFLSQKNLYLFVLLFFFSYRD